MRAAARPAAAAAAAQQPQLLTLYVWALSVRHTRRLSPFDLSLEKGVILESPVFFFFFFQQLV